MNRENVFLLALGGIAAYLYFRNKDAAPSASSSVIDDSPLTTAGDFIVSTLTSWKNVGSGPQWIPYLNQAEANYNLPHDLLARIAYQESHFREDVIRGNKTSNVGASGMMQMMPAFFQSINVPRPYTDNDVMAQINEAAQQMATLYRSTNSWPLALAAYNAGLGNVQKYGGIPPFAETQNYVSQIVADLPTLA